MSGKRKFIVDCDIGTDDAQAIMMALAQPDIDLVAITAVFGNAGVDDTTRNALRVLKVCGKLEVPVYKGSNCSLLGVPTAGGGFHGYDGLGDVPDPGDKHLEKLIKPEHAVQALSQMAAKYPGEITLVALGPLTNLALAIRMDPTFGKNLKDCYIMGGTYLGKGNITCTAEYNTHSDPEAAHVVFQELGCPINLVTLETCADNYFTWEWYDKFISVDTTKGQFVRRFEELMCNKIKQKAKEGGQYIVIYPAWDQLAMAAAITNDVVTKSELLYMTVELQGSLTRGQGVVDWSGRLKKPGNVRVITEVNKVLYEKLIYQGIDAEA